MNISRFRAEATQVQGDQSLLRDWFKGLLYEVAGSLEKALVVNLERELSRSMAIRAMFTSADAAKAIKDKLRALEAQKYKQDMRAMNDVVREITKKLQDSRLAPYLITKDDREHFMRELAAKQEEKPEDANEERDTGEQGNAVHNGDDELEYDYGDYGDARARTADGEEAQDGRAFAEDEGFGS
jgi:DNA polymerase I-like protein with 3'-5' exonuclease and polymerase domains